MNRAFLQSAVLFSAHHVLGPLSRAQVLGGGQRRVAPARAQLGRQEHGPGGKTRVCLENNILYELYFESVSEVLWVFANAGAYAARVGELLLGLQLRAPAPVPAWGV